jgi:hypothetical protein
MGADTFTDYAEGKTADEAFNNVREQAAYDYGHAGYTGTIAEKGSFVILAKPEGVEVEDFIHYAISASFALGDIPEQHRTAALAANEHVDDKWGPAGCIDLGGGKYVFFGWASS